MEPLPACVAVRRSAGARLLFAAARHHASAGAYLARETPFEVMLLSMLIEQQKHVVTLQQKVMTLETRMPHDSTQGMAS